MREPPILFGAPMVRAILVGTKTQTRRVVKFKPHHQIEERDDGTPWPWMYDGERDADWWMPCPYGQTGSNLWVRETFAIEQSVEPGQPLPHNDGRPVKRRPADDHECLEPEWCQAHYSATDPTPALEYIDHDGPHCRWKPSIHMPRWASRILLEITAVRVERLQDISEADALAEGCTGKLAEEAPAADEARHDFRELWESINGPDSWDANPWVWVVEFKRVEVVATPALPSPSASTSR